MIPLVVPRHGRTNHRSCHITMDMHIQIISKIEIALLPLSYHELASRLTSLAAVAGLYCLFLLVSGRDHTKSIKLNWEIQSRTAHTHANRNQKRRKKDARDALHPFNAGRQQICPPFFSREKNARSRKRKVISLRRRDSHALSRQGHVHIGV